MLGRRVRSALQALMAFAVVLIINVWAQPTMAFADSPSITDFGQPAVEQVWATASPGEMPAAFVTLYPDGNSVVQVHTVRSDELNAFASERSLWRLDHGLMWFAQMPVYVREVSLPFSGYGETSV